MFLWFLSARQEGKEVFVWGGGGFFFFFLPLFQPFFHERKRESGKFSDPLGQSWLSRAKKLRNLGLIRAVGSKDLRLGQKSFKKKLSCDGATVLSGYSHTKSFHFSFFVICEHQIGHLLISGKLLHLGRSSTDKRSRLYWKWSCDVEEKGVRKDTGTKNLLEGGEGGGRRRWWCRISGFYYAGKDVWFSLQIWEYSSGRVSMKM